MKNLLTENIYPLIILLDKSTCMYMGRHRNFINLLFSCCQVMSILIDMIILPIFIIIFSTRDIKEFYRSKLSAMKELA